MSFKVPLSDIDLGEEEIEAVTGVLKSKWLSMGLITEDFENNFKKYSKSLKKLSTCQKNDD